MAAPAQHTAEPERLYRIGDVSRLTDTKPFVLRFWETEFPMLQPVKTPKGHRLYRQQDIDLILAIKRLLYQEGFTIPGARRHLAEQLAAASPLPHLVGADASAAPARRGGADGLALTKEGPAHTVTSTAAEPNLQPVFFPPGTADEPVGRPAPREAMPAAGIAAVSSKQHAATLRAVREELRAILTLLGTG